jgi:divalent metal cation (Fe/Co/Zn/Cd) transporter
MSTSHSGGRATENRGIRIALAGYIALVALQLAAYAVTGLLVLLAHSIQQ